MYKKLISILFISFLSLNVYSIDFISSSFTTQQPTNDGNHGLAWTLEYEIDTPAYLMFDVFCPKNATLGFDIEEFVADSPWMGVPQGCFYRGAMTDMNIVPNGGNPNQANTPIEIEEVLLKDFFGGIGQCSSYYPPGSYVHFVIAIEEDRTQYAYREHNIAITSTESPLSYINVTNPYGEHESHPQDVWTIDYGLVRDVDSISYYVDCKETEVSENDVFVVEGIQNPHSSCTIPYYHSGDHRQHWEGSVQLPNGSIKTIASAKCIVGIKAYENGNFFTIEDEITITGSSLSSDIKQDLVNSKKFKIYPNPTTDFVNIEVPIGFNGNIVLLDMNGRVQNVDINYENNKVVMNLRTLPKGTYIINTGSSSHKIVKN